MIITASTRREHVAKWLEAVPYLLFASLCTLAFPHTVDDAYICFRYVTNLIAGQGLVFNPGERIEGYSDPLWIYLLTLPAALGLNLVVSSKLIGIAAATSTLWLYGQLLKKTFAVRRSLRLTAMLFLAAHISMVYYTVAGLETMLYTALILLAVYALCEHERMLAAGAAGLAAICRPEGALLLLAVVPGLCASQQWRRRLLYLALAAAPLTAELAFRYGYYGRWLPNTYDAKAASSLGIVELVQSLSHELVANTGSWAFTHLAFGTLGMLGLLGMLLFKGRHPSMLLSCAALLCFVWRAPQDWMAFGRFYVPLLPLLLVYAFAALDHIVIAWPPARYEPAIVLLCIVLTGWNMTQSLAALDALARGDTYDPAMSTERYLAAGRYLRAHSHPGDLVSAPEIGVIGYMSGLPLIDQLGLTDREAARLLRPLDHGRAATATERQAYARYIFSRHPRFVFVGFDLGDTEPDLIAGSLLEHMAQEGAYALGRRFMFSPNAGADVYEAR